MGSNKVRTFLDENGVKYVTVTHSPAYTAMEIAASAHIPGRELAKTVMVKLDGELAMAVVPSLRNVDFDMLAQAAACEEAELANEEEFKYRFPDCEIGAMPPFGNLYGVPVYSCESLRDDEYIAFNAGTHTQLIRMPRKEYEKLVQPTVGLISRND